MQVRLAFAVAAHLEPEVLIVDEVLAVGDAAFQRKCLGSLERSARAGARCCSSATTCPPSARSASGPSSSTGAARCSTAPPTRRSSSTSPAAPTDVAQAGSVAELTRHRDYFMAGILRFTDFAFVGSEDADKVVLVGDPLDMRFSFRLDRPLGDVLVRLNIYSLDDVMVGQGGRPTSTRPSRTSTPAPMSCGPPSTRSSSSRAGTPWGSRRATATTSRT